jgi:mannose-6-phosphate isomerase-like protein (cupin superfamily)
MGTHAGCHFAFDDSLFAELTAHGGTRPIRTRRVLNGNDSERGTPNFIDLTIVPPGADIGTHTHADDNKEIYVIVSGCGTMLVDGRRFEVSAGDVVVNRPGGTHGFWNTGASEVRMVVIEIPVRLDAPPAIAKSGEQVALMESAQH